LAGEGEGVRQGYYVEPTIFYDVQNSARIAREEIFGPVASVIPFENEAEAIRISNDTRMDWRRLYGRAIFTKRFAW